MEKLRILRKAKGITIKEMSERTGITRKHISDIERGRANPSFKNVALLAAELGADIRLTWEF